MLPTTFSPSRTLAHGLSASAVSLIALMWRGRKETGSKAAWLWPVQALRRNDASLRYTGTGTLVHVAASMLWAGLFEWWRGRNRLPTVTSTIVDAAAVTAIAAVIDLKLTPKRFTPGFERRISPRSLFIVYAGFAAGLALTGALARRRR
jgi:hypothetical protein